MSVSKIINFDEIARSKERADMLEIVDAGLLSIDTKRTIKEKLLFDGDKIEINGKVFSVKDYEKIVVFAIGKASSSAVRILEEIFGDLITYGIGIDKVDYKGKKIEVFKGAHPIPKQENVEISEKIFETANNLTEKDLAIVVVSGGGSSLLCYPKEERDQGEILYEAFLPTGGTVVELNTIRKHISEIKGGGLAKALYPATVITLVMCDVPGNHYEIVASGPTYKDNSSIDDAKKVLEKYNLNINLSFNETPKEDIYFEKVFNFPIISNIIALQDMKNKAESLGYKTKILGSDIYDNTEIVLDKMFAIDEKNLVILGGGEPAINITKKGGTGGRNELMAMSAIDRIKEGDVFASVASDGIDNKSDFAGGIVDYSTKNLFANRQAEMEEAKLAFDAEKILSDSKDLIKTGSTGSNVSDLFLLLRK